MKQFSASLRQFLLLLLAIIIFPLLAPSSTSLAQTPSVKQIEGVQAPEKKKNAAVSKPITRYGNVIRLKRYLLLLTALTLAAGWRFPRLRRGTFSPLTLLLGTGALCALVLHLNFFKFQYGAIFHHHDYFHYYVGGKYFPELRYKNLYDCMLVSDREAQFKVSDDAPFRKLSNDRFGTAGQVSWDITRCKERFTPERWQEFSDDLAVFRARMGEYYVKIRRDYGFNPSPAWLLVGGFVAQHVPSTDAWCNAISFADVVLVLISLLFVGRAFGWEAAALGLIFYGANPVAPLRWTGMSFFRHDWLALTLMGLSLIELKRFRTGAFLLAWGGMIRIFPLVFVCALLGLIFFRSVIRRDERFLSEDISLVQGLSLGLLFALLGGVLGGGDFNVWSEFYHNTVKHYRINASTILGVHRLGDYGVVATSMIARIALLVGAVGAAWRFSKRADTTTLLIISAPLIVLLKMANYDYIILTCLALAWRRVPPAPFILVVAAYLSWLVPTPVSIGMVTGWWWSIIWVCAALMTLGVAIRACRSNDSTVEAK